MKKVYRIILLILALIILSTYNPGELNLVSKKKNELFSIKNIEIVNNSLVNNSLVKNEEIDTKLYEIYNKNIFFVKKSDIEQPLNKINFLDKIEVKKKYPNTIIIKIFETEPVGILYKDNTKYFLDSSSKLVIFDENIYTNQIPNLFGNGAEKNFVNFLKKLKNNFFPYQQIKSLYYFQIGRWDLQLANNKLIKFPQYNIEEAIKESIKLLNHKDFENYNIIDLRVPGKIIVE